MMPDPIVSPCVSNLTVLITTRLATALALVGAAAAPIVAQDFPSDATTADLAASVDHPWAVGESRVQQLVPSDAFPQSSVTVSRLRFRYDGPLGSSQPSVHTIASLEVRIGATDLAPRLAGSEFDANLTSPLQLVVQETNYQLVTDGAATTAPPTGWDLTFDLANPVTVQLPPDGAFVLDMKVMGNSNDGLAPAASDFVSTPPGLEPSVEPDGDVCTWDGIATARLDVRGDFFEGGQLDWIGSEFPPNSPVMVFVSPLLADQRIRLPGTPSCWFYLDIPTAMVLGVRPTNAIGDLPPNAIGGIPIPRIPDVRRRRLYVQGFAPAPVSAANPSGLSSSNYQTIRMGVRRAPTSSAWHLASPGNASASVGSFSRIGSLAFRVE